MRLRISLNIRIRLAGSDIEQWTKTPILRTVRIINHSAVKIHRTIYTVTVDGHFAYLNWNDRQTYRMNLAQWNAITMRVTEVTPA